MKYSVIFFGASTFEANEFFDSDAFSNSKNALLNYFVSNDGLGVAESDVLDLFDDKRNPSDQISELNKFLKARTEYIDEDDLHTIIFVYIGHGYFRDNNSGYFWAISTTEADNRYSSGIDVRTFGQSIKDFGSGSRCVGIIDCCFSGATVPHFMDGGGPIRSAGEETLDALPVSSGTALLCSSGARKASVISSDGTMTLFGRSLIAVFDGWKNTELTSVSVAQAAELSRHWQQLNEPELAVAPIAMAPDQDNGNLLNEPIFPLLRSARRGDRSNTTETSARLDDESSGLPESDQLKVLKLHSAARDLEIEIRELLQKHGVSENLYASTSRVKEISKVLSKIERRRSDGDLEYGISSVTDILGFRLITLFREDVVKTIESLCGILVEQSSNENGVLSRLSVVEATIYDSNHDSASRSIARHIRDTLRECLGDLLSSDAKIKYREDYTSTHLVILAKCSDVTDSDKQVFVPIEVQVRCVFEDVWAEIDHLLRYRISRKKNEGRRRSISVGAESHLQIMKQLLDSVAAYSDVVKEELSVKRGGQGMPLVAIDGVDEYREISERFGVPPKENKAFLELLEEKKALDTKLAVFSGQEITERDYKSFRELRALYAVLGEKLGDLYHKDIRPGGYLSDVENLKDPHMCYLYFLRMEEAFCRLTSDDLDEVSLAIRIYSELVQRFGDYPVTLFRLGQSLGRLDQNFESADAFERSLSALQEIRSTDYTYAHPKLTLKQAEYIDSSIYRFLGFRYWRIAQTTMSMSEYLSDDVFREVRDWFAKATDVSKDGLAAAPDGFWKRKLLNNLLAYSNDSYRLLLTLDANHIDDEETLEELRGLADQVLAGDDVEDLASINILDSLAHAFVRLKEPDRAVAAAERALDFIEQLPDRLVSTEAETEGIREVTASCLRIERSKGRKIRPFLKHTGDSGDG